MLIFSEFGLVTNSIFIIRQLILTNISLNLRLDYIYMGFNDRS